MYIIEFNILKIYHNSFYVYIYILSANNNFINELDIPF